MGRTVHETDQCCAAGGLVFVVVLAVGVLGVVG